ncbi:hypothetical protein [Mucilaginibacter panaciglaebae]|uniref:Uncharacterized protein n=1 Tax=Mucilaginibacter panaciglaebae TaxID=502331 RepID=A0ABP7WJA3_9SPHI
MKANHYVLILLNVLTLLACKNKNRHSVSEAIKSESNTHTDNATVAIAKVAADKLIIPGKSIRQIALNEARSQVMAQLGKPDSADAAMGKSVATWYTDHSKKGYATNIYFTTDKGNDDTARVKVIRITSPSFKINNRLYTGVLLADAQKLYKLDKLGTFKLNNSKRTLYDDSAAGVTFEADRSNNITGIAIHEAGKNVLNAYMAFFGEVNADK